MSGEPFEPRRERYTDCAGVVREFWIEQGPQTDGVVLYAREIVSEGDGGYRFSAWSATQGDAWRRLQIKIARELSRRYLSDTPYGLIVSTDEIAGTMCGDGVVVDGRHIPKEQFWKLLESYEGWPFRLVFEED